MTKSKMHSQRYLACLLSLAFMLGLGACTPQATQSPDPKSALDAKANTTAKETPPPPAKTPASDLSVYQPKSLALVKAYHSGDPEVLENAHAIIDANTKGKDAALALNILALIALDTKELDLARLYGERATLADPEFDESQLTLGRIATAQTRFNEALKHYENAAKLNPKRAIANIAAAALLLNFLDNERALKKAQAAIEIEPQNCQAIAITADAHMANKNFKEAIEHYESLLNQANCKSSEHLLQNVAKIYEVHIQNAQKACQTYIKLLEFSPDNANYKASRDYQCQEQQTQAPSKP